MNTARIFPITSEVCRAENFFFPGRRIKSSPTFVKLMIVTVILAAQILRLRRNPFTHPPPLEPPFYHLSKCTHCSLYRTIFDCRVLQFRPKSTALYRLSRPYLSTSLCLQADSLRIDWKRGLDIHLLLPPQFRSHRPMWSCSQISGTPPEP